MKWKLKELEDAVRNTNSDFYGDKIHEPLQSFHLKSMMAYYHADESERIIKEMLSSTDEITENDSGPTAIAKAIFLSLSTSNSGRQILEAQFKAEANIIASAQAMHSLFDIIATIIYWSFKLNNLPNPIPEKGINLYKIRNTLSGLTEYNYIVSLIDDILSSPEFEYLAAYVNTTKHKSLIPSSLSASFETVENYGISIKKFSYLDFQRNTKTFDKKWSTDFLYVDNQELIIKLLKVGNSLNNHFV